MKKKIKKIFYKIFLLRSMDRRYRMTEPIFSSIVSADPSKLFVITVGFNDHELIEIQYDAFKRFFHGGYEYFVIDNSTKEDEAEATKTFCVTRHINYIRLAKNPGPDGSLHHGLALNWVYDNVIKRYKPARFGFIDFDLFPVRYVDIASHLDRADAWGILTERPWPRSNLLPSRFYFWIGLAFFRAERFHDHDPNFLPAFGVDTGGRIRVDGKKAATLPGVVHHLTSPVIEIAPGIRLWEYGDFVHFTGVTWEKPETLAIKKQWMYDVLKS